MTAGGPTDVTAPVVTFASDTAHPVGLLDLEGGVTDDISGVDRVRLLVRNQQTGEYWNGTAWVSSWSWNLATVTGNDWSLNNVNLNVAGTYVVQTWAWDNDNNRGSWEVNPILNVN